MTVIIIIMMPVQGHDDEMAKEAIILHLLLERKAIVLYNVNQSLESGSHIHSQSSAQNVAAFIIEAIFPCLVRSNLNVDGACPSRAL
jgi:hypothetical protein